MTISSRLRGTFAALTLLVGVAPLVGPAPVSAAPGDLTSDSIIYSHTDASGVTLDGSARNEFATSANGSRATMGEKGDIWVLSAPNFENVLIPTVQNRADVLWIRFSPDGETLIALVLNTDETLELLTVPTAGGTQRSLGTIASSLPPLVEFTPDLASVLIFENLAGADSVRVVAIADSAVTLDLSIAQVLTARATEEGVLVLASGVFSLFPYGGGTSPQLDTGSIQILGLANGSVTYTRRSGNTTAVDLWHVPLVGGTPTRVAVDVDQFVRQLGGFHRVEVAQSHAFIATAAGEYFVFDFATQTRVDLDLSGVNNPDGFSTQAISQTVSPNGDYFVISTGDQVVFGRTATEELEVLPAIDSSGFSAADISDDGTVAYRSSVDGNSSQLLVKRLGQAGPELVTAQVGTGANANVEFSPDGTMVLATNLTERRLVSFEEDIAVAFVGDPAAFVGNIRISQHLAFSEIDFLGNGYLVSQLVNTKSFVYVIDDADSPSISAAPDVSAPAVSASGAPVSFDLPTVTDPTDPAAFAECGPNSGDIFPIGVTTVTCNGLDNTGNSTSTSISFTVTVVAGSTPPLVDPVGDVVVEASSADGGIATFVVPLAFDQFGVSVPVSCDAVSGSVFVLDDTTVTCAATDSLELTSSTSFVVSVVDRTPPEISVSADVVAEATGLDGAAVSFDAPSASDAVDPSVAVTCDFSSGDPFPLGTTRVTCTGTDASDNSGSASFTVTVNDAAGPVVTVPLDLVVEATDADGRAVEFEASASDAVDGPVAVACLPESGSVFALGTTTVTCSATDASDNPGSATFTVTVEDTTGPVVSVPADLVVQTTDADGVSVEFAASATDAVDGPVAVACSPESGSVFAVGPTTVECSASDATGNSADASFAVTVELDVVELAGLEAIVADLEAAIDDAGSRSEARRLTRALRDVNDAINALNQDPPRTRFAIQELARSTYDVERAVRAGFPRAEADAILTEIVEVGSSLAEEAINDAVARDGNARRIAIANRYYDRGIGQAGQGHNGDALWSFSFAASQAEKA